MSEVVVYKGDYRSFAQEFETDLILDPETPEDVFYEGTAGKIQEMQRSMWHVAAAVDWGYRRFGEDVYTKIHDMTGFATSTLKQARNVFLAIEDDRRIPGLSFWIHKEVAGLPTADDADEILAKAHDETWTLKMVREEVGKRMGKQPKTAKNPKGTSLPENCNKPDSVQFVIDFLEKVKQKLGGEYRITADLCVELLKNPHIYSISLNNGESKREGSVEGREKRGGRSGNFVAPSLEDCVSYAVKRGLPKNEGAVFFDYWTSLGWKSRNGPVKDWEARLRTWEHTWRERQGKDSRALPTKNTYTSEELAEMTR